MRGNRSIQPHDHDGWVVREVTGAASTRIYRCPGCDQEIRLGTPHVVVWPAYDEEAGGVDERRHWHSACWAARERRGVKVHRSKNAPRYG
ncbi:MAG: hypothetical protein H0V64_10975 [Geodermatophilaceae bacterium]|nr:hypothetical protein [Geodermatophilaceae bacterium]MDQ3465029.1 hypothetical protein [Actinomycetota bacterium]